MRSNRKTYIYGGTLALASIAFLVDRAMQGSPQAAAAEEVTAATPAGKTPEPRPSSPGQQKDANSDPTFVPPGLSSRWLRELPEVSDVRDLFSPANLLLADSATEGGGPNNKDADPVAQFVSAHRLGATFQDGRTDCAVVDGRVLRPGQVMDGFTLITVEPFRVVFRQGHREAVLLLNAADGTEGEHAAADR